ncbi:MAG: amidohydrolase, partial [Gemmatimonadetes bacterium]|nr:amidohydrolase [Gemmatimonadota bacterium]
VKTSIIAGKIVMRDFRVLTIDEEAVRIEAQTQADLLDRRVAADPLQKELALLRAMDAGQL